MRKIEKVVREYNEETFEAKFIFGVGNLTRDSELRHTTSTGKAVLNGAIAFTTYKGGEKTPEFYNIEAWEKQAERLASFGTKGTQLAIYGKLVEDSYEKDGVKVEREKIIIEGFHVLSPKKKVDNQVGGVEGFTPTDDDDIPF